MNPVIKSQMSKYAEQHSLLLQSQSDLFESFSIHVIENGLLCSNFDANEIHFEGSEFGIDGACITVQDQLVLDVSELENYSSIKRVEFHFFQSKTGSSFESGEILKFFQAVEDFFGEDYETGSDDLIRLKAMSDYIFTHSQDLIENPTIRLFFNTTGNYEKPAPIERLIKRTADSLQKTNLFSQIDFQMIGGKDIQNYYRTATHSETATISFPQYVTMPETTGITESYLGFIDASEIIKMVSNHKTDKINKYVFYDNIRDYDPSTEINKAISDSLSSGEGGLFVFRNNGITVVAKNVNRVGNNCNISDFQIVNGCQTSHLLFENKDTIEDVKIPFRLIESVDGGAISSIIIGTNLQNAVKKEQFWALSSFMKELEEHCAALDEQQRLYIERRDSQYRTLEVEKVRIIKLTVLFKAVAAVLFFKGIRAGRSYSAVYKELQDQVFLDSHIPEPYHFAAYAYYSLESLWRRKKLDAKYKIFRFYILTAIGRVLTEKQNPLELASKRKAQKAVKEGIAILLDEDKLLALLTKVTKVIDDKVLSKDIDAVSLRDHINSETVSIELISGFDELI